MLSDALAMLSSYTRIILVGGCGVMALASWWCQIWRYPAFRDWSAQSFIRRHAIHSFQVSIFVVPGMMLQIVGTGLVCTGNSVPWLKAAHLVCAAGSLLPTFLVSAPIHGQLSVGKDGALIEQLIRANLPRTIFWTVQCLLSLVI